MITIGRGLPRLGFVTLLLLVGPVFAVAGGLGGALPPEGPWDGRPPLPMLGAPGEPGLAGPGRMLDTLDLSVGQKERLKQLRRARRDRMQTLANALDDAREDFEDLLSSGVQGPEFDKQARAKHAEMVALQEQLDGEIFDSILEIRGLLTPGQLKRFNRLHKSMAGRGPGGLGGPGAWGHWPERPRGLSKAAGD